jgi:hypothetical protein
MIVLDRIGKKATIQAQIRSVSSRIEKRFGHAWMASLSFSDATRQRSA